MEELWTIIADLLYQWGGPSVVGTILALWFRRYLKKRDEREDKIEKLMLLMLRTGRANNVLSVATAKAVQRIPDAHCNGDMKEALEKAAEIQNEEKDLLVDEGIKHIFGD